MTPSRVNPMRAPCACSRSWPMHARFSRRFSTHFTGRPSRCAPPAPGRLLGIDRRPSGPKPPPDVGDDARGRPRPGSPSARRDDVAQRVRALRGRRHDERAADSRSRYASTPRVSMGAALSRGCRSALADDQMRPRHRRLRVADRAAGHDRRCCRASPRAAGCRRRERRFGRRQRRQRRVLDGHRVERVGELGRARPPPRRPPARRRGGPRPWPERAGPTGVPSASRRRRSARYGAIAPRSEALQARATPGRRRAPRPVATETSRAWASVLRTTPRCRSPSRARSSRKRPLPVRSRSSPLRRGEAPIISRGNLSRLRKILFGRLSSDARGRPSLDGLAADGGAGAGQPDRRHRVVHVLHLRRPRSRPRSPAISRAPSCSSSPASPSWPDSSRSRPIGGRGSSIPPTAAGRPRRKPGAGRYCFRTRSPASSSAPGRSPACCSGVIRPLMIGAFTTERADPVHLRQHVHRRRRRRRRSRSSWPSTSGARSCRGIFPRAI